MCKNLYVTSVSYARIFCKLLNNFAFLAETKVQIISVPTAHVKLKNIMIGMF